MSIPVKPEGFAEGRPIGRQSSKLLNGQIVCLGVMVGRGGLEPPTSRLSGVRSNHLSYRPS